MRRLGRHILADVSGVDQTLGESEATLLLADMAQACGATLIKIDTHLFGEGHGLTAIAVLAESHISLHEWPEYQFVAFDIFVCGTADPVRAVDLIQSRFPDAHVETRILDRQSQ